MTRAADRLGGFRGVQSERGKLIQNLTGVPQDGQPGNLGHGLTSLPPTAISPNPDNPREELEELEGLAASISTYGVLHPLTAVRREDFVEEHPEKASALQAGATHVVLDGHRRLAAAMLASCEEVPVIVREDSAATKDVLGITFVTQFHAMALSPLAQASILATLIKEHGSQQKVADGLGITQPRISQIMSFNKLSDELQAGLADGAYTVNDLKSLGRRSSEEQKAIADERRTKRQAKKQSKTSAQAPQLPAQSAPPVDDTRAVYAAPLPEEAATSVTPGPGGPTNGALVEQASPLLTVNDADSTSKRLLVDVSRLPRVPWSSGSEVAAMAKEKMKREEIKVLIADLSDYLAKG
ncbi:ParB/RepB/Spo0J family partition protein [Streptomyces sp. NPDC127110]|uniref:ParB/RepB/Spo0J family partition protein n=1 Tax=Streptomyces sp. NPDC127110 TaxID=3345362 RepID=UPI00363E75E7